MGPASKPLEREKKLDPSSAEWCAGGRERRRGGRRAGEKNLEVAQERGKVTQVRLGLSDERDVLLQSGANAKAPELELRMPHGR